MENERNAELEAQADKHGEKNKSEDLQNQLKAIGLTAEFRKKYSFDGKEYDKLDLSGLNKLTTLDAQHIDEVMESMGHHPAQKYKDTLFCKHVAMMVTGLPVEFFNQLSWIDMNEIVSRVGLYFLFM